MHHRKKKKEKETVLKTTAKFLVIGRQNTKLAPFLCITSFFFSGSSKSYILDPANTGQILRFTSSATVCPAAIL